MFFHSVQEVLKNLREMLLLVVSFFAFGDIGELLDVVPHVPAAIVPHGPTLGFVHDRSCTCRMGIVDGAVVDPESLRVHGLSGLRIVDASVMPKITNGDIYAPVMMIAEKAADAILGLDPLPLDDGR